MNVISFDSIVVEICQRIEKQTEMSIAAEKLPLPHRCRDGFQKNVSNFTVATVLDQKYWY
jgi:hypothetical protein